MGRVVSFRLNNGDLSLLDQLCHILGLSRSETVRYCITATHVVVQSGLYRYLKPIPELARIAQTLKKHTPREP